MSIANFLVNGKLYTPDQVSNSENMKELVIQGNDRTVKHSMDANNNYSIASSTGTHLISFDNTASLNNCALKTHINNNINPINLTLDDHETRLASLEDLPTTENLSALQGQVNALIDYNDKLKELVLALKESLFIAKSSTDNSEFDYSDLLN